MKSLSRRDFLRAGSALTGALALGNLTSQPSRKAADSSGSAPSILILVLDAMSAAHLSLYGYPRKTTPGFERFAKRATVFNQHYTTGNFTTPGTASLITGLYPWTHRAINLLGLVRRDMADRSFFGQIGDGYHRIAFTQSLVVSYLLDQCRHAIDELLPPVSFSLMDSFTSFGLGAGWMDADRAIGDMLFKEGYGSGSLVFGLAERLRKYAVVAGRNTPDYPLELPRTITPVYFQLKDVVDGLIAVTRSLPQPALVYMHLWPPHDPYVPSAAFAGMFESDWVPPQKPSHRLVDPHRHHSPRFINEQRNLYDAYIANLDAECSRWFDSLEETGLLDSAYVIVTSDHGEMFERGMVGHETPLLYDPIVRVPLMISAPGQTARQDVDVPTSSVDLLPTLLHLSGQAVPAWCEGRLLPRLGGTEDPERSLFMMEAKTEPPAGPLKKASYAIRKGRYKLIDYMGYPQYRVEHRLEMFDIQDDPEELNNIYSEELSAAVVLKQELMAGIRRTTTVAGM